MVTQINKAFVNHILFNTAISEIENCIHNWKVFFKVINKDFLHVTNKICVVIVIIRDKTKRIMLNISIKVNNLYNELGAIFFYCNGNFDYLRN